MLLPRDVRRDHVPLVLADVRQRPDAVDVADRPQAIARPHELVDLDAAGVDLNTHRLQADALDAGAPAGCDKQSVASQLAGVIEPQHILVAFPPCRGRVLSKHQLYSIPAQRLAQRLAEWGGLAGKQVIGALDEYGLTAEPSHDLCKLHTRGPATQHQK